MKLTLKQLLRWAEDKCFIEIKTGGNTEVQMERDDFTTFYEGYTLYGTLLTAYKAEQGLK